jgi:hypothetical protein
MDVRRLPMKSTVAAEVFEKMGDGR